MVATQHRGILPTEANRADQGLRSRVNNALAQEHSDVRPTTVDSPDGDVIDISRPDIRVESGCHLHGQMCGQPYAGLSSHTQIGLCPVMG
jgi:hypothetical protein